MFAIFVNGRELKSRRFATQEIASEYADIIRAFTTGTVEIRPVFVS